MLPDVMMQQALTMCSPCDSRYLSDVNDGTLCRESAYLLRNSGAIQVLLYQDAFEVVNPLGSAKKEHGSRRHVLQCCQSSFTFYHKGAQHSVSDGMPRVNTCETRPQYCDEDSCCRT